MISLRTKLLLGFGSILVIFAGIGMLIMVQLTGLGEAIDIILRENYRSVVACQDMKEALERIDSGILIALSGNHALGDSLINTNIAAFEKALLIEERNITLPEEQALITVLSQDANHFFSLAKSTQDRNLSVEEIKNVYYAKIFPLFLKTKDQAQKVLVLNQDNMNQKNNQAREQAASAKIRMMIAILFCCILAVVFSFLTRTWVLRPINRLIDSVGEISAGNLVLEFDTGSRDEIGQLAVAFNKMTQALRERRLADDITLQRSQQATKEVISALSSAIAITDIDGVIEISTESAKKLFGLKVGLSVFDTSQEWLPELYKKATQEGVSAEYPVSRGYLQVFSDFKEYFFQPVVIPVTINNNLNIPPGVVILFRDKTLIYEQQELKQSVISTVSHQLKTPLTSLRMSIHLLLDERLGTLNEKQMELLQAAQEESERLTGIVENLLDIRRINKTQQMLETLVTNPEALVQEAVYPFISEIRDKGIKLKTDIAEGLPCVKVDTAKLAYVFANLINNAIHYTPPGGNITISAKAAGESLRFQVTDTGSGIAPEYLGHLFEEFYRVPNSEHSSGVGLGLAIVKEIVQAHGGKVGVESELNHGSTFWFELPAVPDTFDGLRINLNGGK
jgi:signal transduction histidine kinase/HAMP domain-containing protein